MQVWVIGIGPGDSDLVHMRARTLVESAGERIHHGLLRGAAGSDVAVIEGEEAFLERSRFL